MTEKRELARLVKRIQKGDAEAFGQLYDRFHDKVFLYVYRQTGSGTDAEDITAGVFLYVLEKIDGFTWRGAGFAAWLFRIARNDVLDYFRKRGNGAREVALTDEIMKQPSHQLVEEQAEASFRDHQLRLAIAELSEEQQQVVLLKLTMNFSNRQVGEVLGKSEGAIKALTHRALLGLRKKMEEQLMPRNEVLDAAGETQVGHD
ncbi:MAG: RNA polymerase sigma factor [Thermoleophilia bacterium]